MPHIPDQFLEVPTIEATEAYCSAYERWWNFEADRSIFDEATRDQLRSLFRVVAYFSPYPEDRKSYPGFKSELQVQDSVRELLTWLERNKDS